MKKLISLSKKETENFIRAKLRIIMREQPLRKLWELFRSLLEVKTGTSLVAQWLRICLPMQGTRVRALVWEDPACCGATKPMRHNYWACALEPMSHNYWACVPQLLRLRATTTEAWAPRAHAPQQEKPPQWEAHTPQRRVTPARCN